MRSYLNLFVFSRPLKGIFLYDKSSGDFRMSDFGRRQSKFQVQSQQTATVLKMKDPLSTCCVSISFKTCFISQNTLDQNINMNPTARGFMNQFPWNYDLEASLSFSTTNSIKMWNVFQKPENTSAKNLWWCFNKGSSNTVTARRVVALRLVLQLLVDYVLVSSPVSGLSWSLLILKDYKNLLANSSGPQKKCQTSRRLSHEFFSVLYMFLFCYECRLFLRWV